MVISSNHQKLIDMQAKRKITCREAKRIDINLLLKSLGYKPTSEKEKESWYLSPFRSEKDASFRVNNCMQLWYDYGLGQGGDIIKLGCILFSCDVAGFLNKLEGMNFSFSQPISKKMYDTNEKIKILSIHPISDPHIITYIKNRAIDINVAKRFCNEIHFSVNSIPYSDSDILSYIKKRAIDIDIAKRFCKEIHYSVNSKRFKSIGFPNRSGGWELRSKTFKGATSKDISLICRDSSTVCVFEGFFDLLSYVQLKPVESKKYDLLSLNSLALIDKSLEILVKYKEIKLFLDNDEAGEAATERILGLKLSLTIDNSKEYSAQKDLNEHLVETKAQQLSKSQQVNLNNRGLGGISM